MTQDYLASRDDSNLRSLMLKQHWFPKGPPDIKGGPPQGIAGIVDLGVQYVHVPTIDIDKESSGEDTG